MKKVLLLHGALGAEDQLMSLKTSLASHYFVYSLNFSGHGGKASEECFSIEQFSHEVLSWMSEMNIEKLLIFGYSMGGYVALYLAKHHPEKVEKIITLGTKLHWSVEVAEKEGRMLQPDVIQQKVPKFAEELKERHGVDNWKSLMNKTASMLKRMGEDNPLKQEDYKAITAPVLLMIGDRDKMVTLDETVEAYKSLPTAQLAVLPATPHAIEQVDVDYISFGITKFLTRFDTNIANLINQLTD